MILNKSLHLSKFRFLISTNGDNTGYAVIKSKNLGKLDIDLSPESATNELCKYKRVASLCRTQYSHYKMKII